MAKIETLFKNDIRRRIEEVIKVDQDDEATVKTEIQEYVATDAIKEHFYLVYDSVAKYPSEPHEGIGIWVSGFFGSGKSLFAKLLSYTIANRQVVGKGASQWFIENVQDEQITNYLQNINSRFPIHAIIFDVAMDRGVRTANERITEVMYKALLRELGYAEDFDLAELEITLEAKGKLDEFIKLFNKAYAPVTWEEERDMAMGIVEASDSLHKMMPDVFTTPDSWANSLGRKEDSGEFIGRADISANELAKRAFELISRRKPGHGLMFVIDEVGQYVYRSVDKMLDLQAVIQAFGVESKNRFKAKKAIAPCWIVVTSQEKLNEVVDALDSKKIELARLQDRFPIPIDLKQSDIQEVTAKRVLPKNQEAEKVLGELFDKNQGRLKTFCTLERTSRDTEIKKEEFINLYPYVPYQIDLCIDIVAGLRLKRGAQRHIGGSNRTIIKQAQQMLIHPRTNLAEKEIGALVTLDLVYELLYAGSLLPSEVTREVDDVPKHLPGNEMAFKVAKAIALLEAVKDLPRTPHNIAATLQPSIESDSILEDVQNAIAELEKAQIIRESEEGYKLLTVQEKNWDTTRAGLEPKPKNRNLIKQEIIDEIFSAPKTRTYRFQNLTTFRIGLWVDNEKLQDGAIPFSLHVGEDSDELKEKKNQIRALSREDIHRNEIFWTFPLTEEIHHLVEELFRSREMISTYSRLRSQNQITTEESACLEEEKQRENRSILPNLKAKMTKAIESGSGFFRGVEKDGSALGSSISEIVTGMFDFAVPDLYPKLEMGARNIKGDESEKFLTAANLTGLPSVFYDGDDGLNLVVKQGNKFVPNINAEIAKEILDYIKREYSYGNKVTGRTLEAYFQAVPYGWERDILRLVLAVLLRGGAIEITHQGRKFRGHSEPEARIPLTNNNAFRAATFSPRETIDLKMLNEAAKHYEEITGDEVDIDEDAIATAFNQLANEDREMLLPLQAKVNALGLPLKEVIDEFRLTVDSVLNSPSDDCVKTLAGEGMSYKESRENIRHISEKLSDKNLEIIQKGRTILYSTLPLLEKLGAEGEVTEFVCVGLTDASIRNSVDEHKAHDKAEALKSAFAADDFYERLESIRQNSEAIATTYNKIYETKHDERKVAFEKSIEVIRGHANFGLFNQDDQKAILNPFVFRYCEQALMSDGNVCDNCKATMEQMDSDILAIQGLQDNAFRRIEKLTAPEEKIEFVRVSELISGYLEKEEDIEIAIKTLKEHLLKMLAEGYKISLQ